LPCFTCPDGSGYWLATDQFKDRSVFHVYSTVDSLAHIGAFVGDVVANTDGVWLSQTPPRRVFPAGAFYAVHDDQGVAAFDWRDVACGAQVDRGLPGHGTAVSDSIAWRKAAFAERSRYHGQLTLLDLAMIAEAAREALRRRTFAIISHPDAGKTTLTEKLLLFGGAIQMAGSVKGRKAARHATSDWMALEKERGISVTSSVMQFPYEDCIVNLLDTPGTCRLR
jgi:hypothetical protein